MFSYSNNDFFSQLELAFEAYSSDLFSVTVFAFLLFCFCYGFSASRRNRTEDRLWKHLWRGYALALVGVLVIVPSLVLVWTVGAWLFSFGWSIL